MLHNVVGLWGRTWVKIDNLLHYIIYGRRRRSTVVFDQMNVFYVRCNEKMARMDSVLQIVELNRVAGVDPAFWADQLLKCEN